MDLQITKYTPIYRNPENHGVFLQWTISGATTSDITFDVARSVSPEGPFEEVITNLRSYYYYDQHRDKPEPAEDEYRENLNHLSLVRSIYYRVTATAADGSTTVTLDVGNSLPRKLFLLHRKMQRDLSVALKFNGVPTYVVKRLHWGVRCKACFDLLTKKVTNSKCKSCYGTGFENGYANPVEIRGRFFVPNSDTQITPQGLTDLNKLRFLCLQYPNIDPLDIIVSKELNRRYIVQQQSQTELRRETVHQSLLISELSRDSIEYQIPVNTDSVPVIY